MEKEFEIKLNRANKQVMKSIFRTKHSDLELLLPLDNGVFDFDLINTVAHRSINPVKEGEHIDRELTIDSNLFIESVSQVIRDRLHKEVEENGEPETELAELVKSVQNDIKKGFDDKLKEIGVNHNVDDIEIKFTDGSTTFSEYSGYDIHQFCFEVSHLNKISKFEFFVTNENPKVNREGLQKDYGKIFGSNERFNYVMDKIDAQIKQQIKEEQEMDFTPYFLDAPEKEPKSKKSKKRDRGHGFSM